MNKHLGLWLFYGGATLLAGAAYNIPGANYGAPMGVLGAALILHAIGTLFDPEDVTLT